MNDKQKASSWDRLMELCGHWQDGSDCVVTLLQDDATRECVIKTSTGLRASAGTFEAAVIRALTEVEAAGWSDEKLGRKIEQEHDMAALARVAGDTQDASRHAVLAQVYTQVARERRA